MCILFMYRFVNCLYNFFDIINYKSFKFSAWWCFRYCQTCAFLNCKRDDNNSVKITNCLFSLLIDQARTIWEIWNVFITVGDGFWKSTFSNIQPRFPLCLTKLHLSWWFSGWQVVTQHFQNFLSLVSRRDVQTAFLRHHSPW